MHLLKPLKEHFVTQGQYLAKFKKVSVLSHPSPRRVVVPRSQSTLLYIHNWSWIPTFPQGISGTMQHAMRIELFNNSLQNQLANY